MPTFKPVIRPTQKRKDGKFNIKILVVHNRKGGYLPTELYIFEKEIDDNGKINSLYRSWEDADEMNMKLLVQMGGYASKISKNKDQVKMYSLPMLLKFLREETDPSDLLSIFNRKIKAFEEAGNKNYGDNYKYTQRRIEEFIKGKTLPVDLVTQDWLKRFESFIMNRDPGPKKKKVTSRNTPGAYMRAIRVCYNDAITEHATTYDSYPFRGYRIPREKPRKRNLTALEVAKIYRLKTDDPVTEWARSMFILLFCLIGINMKDLVFLDKIDDGRIYYTRSKGKKKYSIKVQPEALEIIQRYHGKKYLLSMMDKYKNYRDATDYLNIKLKDVAVACGITKPLCTYYSRHSWSTIGRSIGVSTDDISMGLGHKDPDPKKDVTFMYLDDLELYQLIDQANRKIIDHIISIEVPKIPLA